MAIRSSLWLVLMSLAGVACDSSKISLEVGNKVLNEVRGFIYPLTLTFGEGPPKSSKGGNTQPSSYNCIYKETKLDLRIELKDQKDTLTAVHVAINSKELKEVDIANLSNKDIFDKMNKNVAFKKMDSKSFFEEVDSKIQRICIYQGSWYPQRSNNPEIYIKIDFGIEKIPDLNTFILSIEVEDKILNVKLMKKVYDSDLKEDVLALNKPDEAGITYKKPKEFLIFNKLSKQIYRGILILRNFNCELESTGERIFQLDALSIAQKGNGCSPCPFLPET